MNNQPTSELPAATSAPVLLRYVGDGYYTLSGLPARDLTAADFIATHWTPEEVLKVQPPVYEPVTTKE